MSSIFFIHFQILDDIGFVFLFRNYKSSLKFENFNNQKVQKQ